MTTREVPQAEWETTLNRVCEGAITRHVTVDVLAPDVGAQRLVTHLPLIGLEVSSQAGRPATIAITTAPEDPDTMPFIHVVARPAHVFLEEDAEGALHALDIEDEGHTKTLLMFDQASAA
ncbi:MAG: DUF5335 family protein [Candidatus Sericytochromatia bacterium]|nr:DUF5335 family protein [Candidatus Sericytochromatia bacterium]